MKNLKHLTKAFAVHAMIFSLLQSSFVFSSAFAADKNNITGNELVNVANQALNVYGSFLGMKQQMVAQQIAATKNAQLMQTLSPNCRKADGTSCYTVAGKYFPECPLPASMTSMPQNVCSSATPDPTQIASMLTYETISKSWINYFDQMQNEASNAAVPFGLKCLDDKRKALDSQLTEMVNNLTRLQDQLNKDKETFKANNKKLMEDLALNNEELNGGAGNNLKTKTTDPAKYFSQACQTIIGKEGLAAFGQVGFTGIMRDVSPKNKSAADFNSNKALIESDIRRDIDKLTQSISAGGVDDYIASTLSSTPTNASKNGAVNAARVKQAQEFTIAKQRIAKEIRSLTGEDLPALDKNFSGDFDTFLANSQEFMKKKYINDCVTGADKSGIALSTDQILKSLQQKSTNSEGTARDKYKAALSNILNSDAFIEDKMAQIKALDETYKGITITYQDSNAQRVTQTPYDLYMKTIASCETRYTQNDQFANSGSTNTSANVSQKKKTERAQALLRELKNLNDNYASNMSNQILDQALNCAGETKKSGDSCDTAFDTGNANFCISTASLCANEINGCANEINNHITTRKAKMESLAKTFNANAEALVARSNQLYTAQKNSVMDMIKAVQGRFPGTNFQIPQDMFISMPELKKDTYGIDLVNDGNLSFMDDLPKKIDLLKKVFQDQQKLASNEIKDYIQKQSDAMSREKERWQTLADQCTKNIDTSSREIAKMNNENAKKQAEQDGAVAQFCQKYADLRTHPAPGCKEDAQELAEDMGKVVSRITANAKTIVGEIRATCNSYNNEAADPILTEDCDLRETNKSKSSCYELQKRALAKAGKSTEVARAPRLSSLCAGKDTSNKDFFANLAKQLPADERDKLKDVTNMAEAKKIAAEKMDSYQAADFLDNLSSVVNDSDSNICEKLTALPSGDQSAKVKEYTEKLPALKTAKDTADKALADFLTANKGALNDEQTKKKDELADAALKASSAYNAVNDPLDSASKSVKLSDALNVLKKSAPSQAEKAVAELTDLGEQSDGSCDAQASNINLPKDFGNTFLNNFDNAILGRTK